MKQDRAVIIAITAVIGLGQLPQGPASAEPGALSIEATKHMVKECRQQHENVANTVDELLVELENAQRSLDAARTRAVLELSQMRLADLKQDIALCANLMNMIDRRTSEHETSQRDQPSRRHESGELDQETNRLDQTREESAPQ